MPTKYRSWLPYPQAPKAQTREHLQNYHFGKVNDLIKEHLINNYYRGGSGQRPFDRLICFSVHKNPPMQGHDFYILLH